jgi:hypothetical protein
MVEMNISSEIIMISSIGRGAISSDVGSDAPFGHSGPRAVQISMQKYSFCAGLLQQQNTSNSADCVPRRKT